MRLTVFVTAIGLVCSVGSVHAQTAAQTSGALVIVPAYGEVRQFNDEAHAVFMVEEQDHDKVAAASRVNLKMKQGTDILRHEDPQGVLQTRGYYTYPVYVDEQPRPMSSKSRQIVGWRVGQYLDMRTTNIAQLPKTVAAVQTVLALNGLQFGLSEGATKKLDARRIEAAYKNLGDRIAAIAKAMGRNSTDATIETIDFEASGAYAQNDVVAEPRMAMRSSAAEAKRQIEEPNFEPGEATLRMQVVGKVRFK
jgi:uncharacterized protein YggE